MCHTRPASVLALCQCDIANVVCRFVDTLLDLIETTREPDGVPVALPGTVPAPGAMHSHHQAAGPKPAPSSTSSSHQIPLRGSIGPGRPGAAPLASMQQAQQQPRRSPPPGASSSSSSAAAAGPRAPVTSPTLGQASSVGNITSAIRVCHLLRTAPS